MNQNTVELSHVACKNKGGGGFCTVITLIWQAFTLLNISTSIAFNTSSPLQTVPNWLLFFNTGIHHLHVLLLNSPQTSAQSHQAVQRSAFMGLSIKWLLISKSECRQAPRVSFTRLWDSKCALFFSSEKKLYLKIYGALLVSKPLVRSFFSTVTMELRWTDFNFFLCSDPDWFVYYIDFHLIGDAELC